MASTDQVERAADHAAFRSAFAQLRQDARDTRYRHDVAAWARDRLGVHLWSKQREIAESIMRNRRTAVQSAAGIGKSFLAAIIALWWIDTHPHGDALVVTTAPSAEQVQSILWEEIRKHHAAGGLPGTVQQGMPVHWVLDGGRKVGIGRKPADHSTSAFQGLHRRYVLVILDEAGGCPINLWAGAERITTNEDCRLLAIGNPDDNSSHFAKICLTSQLWHRVKVSAFDTPNLTGEDVPAELRSVLPSAEQVADLAKEWGEDHPLYVSTVLGEFADAADGLIPLSWIRAAQYRWSDWREREDGLYEPSGPTIWACDVARFGPDRTAIAERKGNVVYDVETWTRTDSAAVIGLCEARMESRPQSRLVMDADGIGGPVVDMLRQRGRRVVAFSGAAATQKRDRTGTQRFANTRSAAWYNMRELLDPTFDSDWCLPNSRGVREELAAPKWPDTTGNVIKVESKADFAKRLGRSPDIADAIVMSAWVSAAPRNGEELDRERPGAIEYANGYETASQHAGRSFDERPGAIGYSAASRW